VLAAVRFRHEDGDLLSGHLPGGVAEHPFGRRTERLDDSGVADRHHRVGNIVEYALKPPALRTEKFVGVLKLCRAFPDPPL
jgi:hypothetical protein